MLACHLLILSYDASVTTPGEQSMNGSAHRNIISTMSDDQLQTLIVDETEGGTALVNDLVQENLALRQEVQNLRMYRSLAYKDPLTGLRNRRYLEERLAEEIDRSRRVADGIFSVLLVDLDDFKAVNDTFGHAEGDRILIWAARFLEQNVRDHDIVCRTGGDEFVILLPNADEEGSRLLIERLRSALETANAGRIRSVGLSVGSATWPDNGSSADRLIESADLAMYQNKQRKKAARLPAKTVPMRVRVVEDETIPWGGPTFGS
jgi:diguanylate cyclase (GGDEF)-like protein